MFVFDQLKKYQNEEIEQDKDKLRDILIIVSQSDEMKDVILS
jgi:hypothetical protein